MLFICQGIIKWVVLSEVTKSEELVQKFTQYTAICGTQNALNRAKNYLLIAYSGELLAFSILGRP
jgi:hypothetical protein